MEKEKDSVQEKKTEDNPKDDEETYCIRISLNLGVALCNGIPLFSEDLVIEITVGKYLKLLIGGN